MLSFFAFILVFDIVSKYVVESKLGLGEEASFLPGFMNFVVVHNDGAAWNLFSGFGILLIVVTFIFLLIYFWFFCTKKTRSVLFGIASGLILGGTVGNLYDRLFYGYVRDFLNFQFIRFPVFNIADAGLCVGIFLLAVYLIFVYTKEVKSEKEELIKQGYTDEPVKIDTSDLDKIDTHKFKIRDNINIRKMIEYNNKNDKNKEKTDDKG